MFLYVLLYVCVSYTLCTVRQLDNISRVRNDVPFFTTCNTYTNERSCTVISFSFFPFDNLNNELFQLQNTTL